MNVSLRPRVLKALLADLDGTLVDSALDYPLIRSEIGATDLTIVQHLDTLSGDFLRRSSKKHRRFVERAKIAAVLCHQTESPRRGVRMCERRDT